MNKALVGVELWKLYLQRGKRLPASWVARAVNVSPTTMSKYLKVHCPEYEARKGWTPGKGWNWCSSVKRVIQEVMDTFWSNGERFDAGDEPPQDILEELEEGLDNNETGLDYEGAMMIVEEGLAVCRMADCGRVIFKREGETHVGFSEDNSVCVSKGLYQPSDEDRSGLDWMIDAHLRGPDATEPMEAEEEAKQG